MAYAKVLVFSVVLLGGCSSESFHLATVDANVDAPKDVNQDGGLEVSNCPSNSCKSGCGTCEAEMRCNAGSFLCGSKNCSSTGRTIVDAASFDCPLDMALTFECFHTVTDTKDFMPSCLFRGGSTANGYSTYWCCYPGTP